MMSREFIVKGGGWKVWSDHCEERGLEGVERPL